MKVQDLVPWILAGGLAASTIFNIQLMRRLDEVETRLSEPAPASSTDASMTLPDPLVSKLGLTEQQCNRIVDCSVH